MKWLLRALGWATVLIYPCVLLATPYERLLITVTAAILQLPLRADMPVSADLSAANALGIYGALCLACTSQPRTRRWLALSGGVLTLVLVELLVGILSVRAAMYPHTDDVMARFGQAGLDAERWAAVPFVWFVTLGRYELERARPPGGRKERNPGSRPSGAGVVRRTHGRHGHHRQIIPS